MPVTFGRGLLVTAMLASVGVGLVMIRQEMARCSHRIQRLHMEQVRLEQDLWTRQMDLARLRVPEKLRERIEQFGVAMEPPRVERRAARAQEAGRHGVVRTHD